MKRVECGAYMAEEGVWMNLAEAEAVKMELKARGTKHAVFLANAITFTDGTIYRGDNDALVTRQGQMIKDALDVLQECQCNGYSMDKAISRAREILIGKVEVTK